VRNKTELRSLALDERQRFVNSLGRKEIHDMPASQIKEVYKPSFSIPVSPDAELSAPYGVVSPVAPGPENPSPTDATPSSSSGTGETPFNTTEIGPTSMNKTGGAAIGAPSASGVTATSAPLDPGTGAISTGGPAVGSELGASKGVTPALAP
jgi:hypothetical protein